MSPPEAPRRSRVPWALAVTVGLCSGLAGYVIHAARVNRIPKQVVTVKRLTDMPGAEESPAISPDGKAVAFVAAVGDKRQIWVGQPITKDDADHFGPRWTPDSKSLIYFANELDLGDRGGGRRGSQAGRCVGSGRSEPRWQTGVFPARRSRGRVDGGFASRRHADGWRHLFEFAMVTGRQEDRVLAGHERNGGQRVRRRACSSSRSYRSGFHVGSR